VRRPSVADEEVDAALRTRTARVAAGIGLFWLGGAVTLSNNRISFLAGLTEASRPGVPAPPGWFFPELDTVSSYLSLAALLVGVGCWIWVANPTRRSLVTSPR
jgi:hypothetical protein